MKKVYLIGSLRNEKVPQIAKVLRERTHHIVFDDWYAAGPEADDYWQAYEKNRGHKFGEALRGNAGQHVYKYDKHHLDDSDAGVLVLPAGKSGHLEAGYLIGQGKPVFILLDGEPERYDVMYSFARGIYTDLELLCAAVSLTLHPLPTKRADPTFLLEYKPTRDPHYGHDHLPEGSS